MSKKTIENPIVNLTIGKELAQFLKLQGFIVQLYQEKSGIVVIRLDCGMANTIKIGNHKKNKNLKYMFLVDPSIEMLNKVVEGNTTQYVYGKGLFDRMRLLNDLNTNKQKKVKRAGGMNQYIPGILMKKQLETSSKGRWGADSFV